MAEEFEVSGETVLLMRIRFMDLLKKKWSWWFFVSFFIYFVYLSFFPLLSSSRIVTSMLMSIK